MQSLKGQCFCGQVQFRISPPESAPPVHRRPTHTAAIAASQLEMLKGEVHTLSWGEGASWQECRSCRTRLFYRQSPGEEIYVQLGAIRDRFRCRNLRLPDWLPVGPAPIRVLRQLHRATQLGQFSKVRRLLTLGLSVDAEVGGQTALEIAAHHGRMRICRLLLNHGADVRRALRHAWQKLPADHLRPLLRLLLAHGYPAQDLLPFAIDSGVPRALALILSASVDLNRLDEEGKTLLEQASGSPGMLGLLLKHGVDTTLVGRDGWHALGVCAYYGMTRSVGTLLEGGFPPDLAIDGAPGAALRYACFRGHLKIVRLLLQFGANPNLADEGETPLMLACEQGSLAVVEMLLEAGADPAARDGRGRTAVERVEAFLPELLVFARERAEGWPGEETVRHRWAKNSAGEFRLKVHKGDRCRAWTDGHAAIAHRLDPTAAEPTLRERANPQPRRGSFPVDGGCECGALRFRLHAPSEPEPVPAILSEARMVGVRESQLEILSGPDSLNILCPDEDTSNWWRCASCRVREVIFQTPEAPGCRYIPIKYLDDSHAVPENLYRTAPLQPRQQALHWAAQAGDTPRVARLLAKGWPVDVEVDGWTPLQRASNAGSFRAARLLLSQGADARKAIILDGHSSLDDLPAWLETLIQHGCNPQKMLGQVVEGGTPAAVRVLLRAGADLKQPDDEGVHALLLASHNGCAMLRFIMRAEPEPVLQSGGLHALGFCAVFGFSGRARTLLQSGFPVNLCERDGPRSALISACGAGRVATARVLLEHGADVNLGRPGVTPLMTAAARGSVALIDLLLEFGADPRLRDPEGRTALDYAEQDRQLVKARLGEGS